MINGNAIRERIRVRLAVIGKSQSELCRQSNQNSTVFSDWIRRMPNITLTSLDRIAELLDVSPSWLLEGDLQGAVIERSACPDNF